MQAAEAAGYIKAETEWEECLRSAATTQMPSSIRRLYAQTLLYCHPTNPTHLWNLFRAQMRTRSRMAQESDYMLDLLSIRHIKTILLSNGSSLEDCGLGLIENSLVRECGNDAVNAAQERIVNAIVEASRLPKGTGNKLYFIDGKAGCGKTHTLNTLINLLEAEGKRVLATASTGIAATLLKHE
ncbi:unnamed protein product [Cylicostephanus goldi]|uniref:ATP-dependent DNA helicase n=1 Tax=Cylicostephanus goldi TaxID=71465 RepID=A0A3P7MQL7_CYLGO|nr:unnamed protein product [Cylicostephanus goldi]